MGKSTTPALLQRRSNKVKISWLLPVNVLLWGISIPVMNYSTMALSAHRIAKVPDAALPIFILALFLGRIHLLAPCSGDAKPISKNNRSGTLWRHDVFGRTGGTLGGCCGCSRDLWFVIHPHCAPSEAVRGRNRTGPPSTTR